MYRHVVLQPPENMLGTLTRSYLLRPEPLSHLILNYIFDAVADFNPIRWDQAIPRDFTNITLRVGSTTIVDIPGDQLGYLNAHLWHYISHSQNRGGDNQTARGAYTFLIPLGRKLYDPNECLPQQTPNTTELILRIGAQQGGFTARLIGIEAVHIPDARPLRHLRYQERTLPTTEVTPNNDIILPHGNTIHGIQIRQSLAPARAAEGNVADRLTILANQSDYQVINADWYSVWASSQFRQAIRFISDERATENTAAAYVQNAETLAIRGLPGLTSQDPMLFSYLNLDPTGDGTHAIDTRAFKELKLRINSARIGEVRIVPIESINA